MKKHLAIFLLILVSNFAFGQYSNQTSDIYSSKTGNLYVKASYTSTNMHRADRTIYLKSRNENSNSRDMLNWTNGGYKEIREFLYKLINSLEQPTGTRLNIGYMYSANVLDANNIKVINTMGGYSTFNRKEMLLLLQAIRDKE